MPKPSSERSRRRPVYRRAAIDVRWPGLIVRASLRGEVFYSVMTLVLIQAALLIGILLKTTPGATFFASENSKLVLTAMATLCLGFGAGILAYWRSRHVHETELVEKFDRLDARAETLMDQLRSPDRKASR